MATANLVRPTAAEFAAADGNFTHAVVALEFVADAETPITLARKLGADQVHGFILESAEGAEDVGRFSFVGPPAREVLTLDAGEFHVTFDGAALRSGAAPRPLETLQTWLDERRVRPVAGVPPLQAGAVGWLGYEAFAQLEDLQVPDAHDDDPQVPLARWLRVDAVCAMDHLLRRLYLCVVVPLTADRAAGFAEACTRLTDLRDRIAQPLHGARALQPLPMPSMARQIALRDALQVTTLQTPERLREAIGEAREAVRDGECFQIVVSQRFTAHVALTPFQLYRALRAINPSPYLFCLTSEGGSPVGASPELLVRVQRGQLATRPIAGTRRRGLTPEEDRALARELKRDEKELAEHRMLVDLGRNDLGRVAAPGRVRVVRRERIERFSHVQHIVTDVTARLDPQHRPMAAVAACFPAGTVSGAPKVRAAEWIARLEERRRGLYAGAVGFFDVHGDIELCIAIRTAVVQADRVHVQAGAGVVFDSDPTREAEECAAKARAALTAVALASAQAEAP